jgi:hypothetical protein
MKNGKKNKKPVSRLVALRERMKNQREALRQRMLLRIQKVRETMKKRMNRRVANLHIQIRMNRVNARARAKDIRLREKERAFLKITKMNVKMYNLKEKFHARVQKKIANLKENANLRLVRTIQRMDNRRAKQLLRAEGYMDKMDERFLGRQTTQKKRNQVKILKLKMRQEARVARLKTQIKNLRRRNKKSKK